MPENGGSAARPAGPSWPGAVKLSSGIFKNIHQLKQVYLSEVPDLQARKTLLKDLVLKQEEREQGTTSKRMIQPLRI